MNDSPCHKCDQEHPGRRYFGCFADCADYKAWKAAQDAATRKIYQERHKDAKLTHYEVDSAIRSKKRYRRKK